MKLNVLVPLCLLAVAAIIKPAVAASQDFALEKQSTNTEFVKCVAINSVKNTLGQIREKSPILKEMEDKGQIKIVRAFYQLADCTLEFVQ